MNLLVSGQAVSLNRLPYPDGGHILQIVIKTSDLAHLNLHRSLVEALKRTRNGNGGVMDVEEQDEMRPNETEIRVLEGFELEVIDLARLVGHEVTQAG